ncbi:MAG: hypothetical protein COA91_04425 [Robiginitomaculum sp.]|nr:MAG: hypothetical protein COA91_04425 [Robiginitomaculum sp.]
MPLIDLAPPLVEPIDLAYAKLFMRVDGTSEDTLIENLIKTARHQVENSIGRTLVRRSFIYKTSIPHARHICLPRPPLVSVVRMTLIAENDQAVDIPQSDYTVTTKTEPGEIRLNPDKNWTDYLAEFTILEIQFEAGYGDTPDDIPLPIRQAIVLLVTHAFEFREAAQAPAIPAIIEALLAPYKTVRL